MLRWILIIGLCLPAYIRAETLVFSEYGYVKHLGPVEDQPVYRIVSEALARVGYDFEVRFDPVKRAIHDALSGKTDGLLFQPYTLKEMLPRLIRVEFQLFEASIYFYSVQKPEAYDICNQRLGMVLGYDDLASQFAQLYECKNPIQPHYGQQLQQMINMIQADRLDWVVAPEVLEPYLNSEREKPLYRLQESEIKVPLYMYLNERNKHLAEPIAEALKQIYQEKGINSKNVHFFLDLDGK